MWAGAVTYGLERINEDVSRWMLGGPEPPENLVYSQDSVVWNRSYSRYAPPFAGGAQREKLCEGV